MSVKEYREFYLRDVLDNISPKKDQEVGYPTTHVVDGVSRGNRFLADHYPSDGVFAKFLESICFKLNPEDTAGTNQGLVAIPSNQQFMNGTDVNTSGQTLAVKPSQVNRIYFVDTLPVVPGAFKSGDWFFLNDQTNLKYGAWYLCSDASVPTFDQVGRTHPIPESGATGEVLEKIDGAHYNVQWVKPAIPNGTKTYKIKVTQAGVAAPVITSYYNGLGGVPVASYVAAGIYLLTLNGAFPANKTFIKYNNLCLGGGVLGGYVVIRRVDNDTIGIYTTNPNGTPTNALLANNFIEIEVLP